MKQALSEMRGDAVTYLMDKPDAERAPGCHEANYRGIPYGFVFTALGKQLKESWTVTLSHEALELLGDVRKNLLVQAPHPENPKNEVFHWFEMCDAVQSLEYEIDGIEVSAFVLPLYFTAGEQDGGRNDFLGTKGLHNPLASRRGATSASMTRSRVSTSPTRQPMTRAPSAVWRSRMPGKLVKAMCASAGMLLSRARIRIILHCARSQCTSRSANVAMDD